MRELVYSIYAGNGLVVAASPWLSTLLVFALFGGVIYVATLSLVLFRRSFRPSGVAFATAVVLWFAMYLSAAIVAIAILLPIGENTRITDDWVFSSYVVVLCVASNFPFWYLLWRHDWFSGKTDS